MKKDNIKIDPNETVWYGQDSTGSRCGAFMDPCEDCSEPLLSMKDEKFLNSLSNY
jgi:hypothetical protein